MTIYHFKLEIWKKVLFFAFYELSNIRHNSNRAVPCSSFLVLQNEVVFSNGKWLGLFTVMKTVQLRFI